MSDINKTIHGKSQWEQWMEAGQEASRDGRLDLAETCYQRAVSAGGRIDPNDPRRATALCHLAGIQAARDDAEAACDSYAEALTITEQYNAADGRELQALAADYIALLQAVDRDSDAEQVVARVAAIARRSATGVQPR